MNIFLGTQERESLGPGESSSPKYAESMTWPAKFVSLFSLLSSQPGHTLILAREEEEQERMEASGHGLKRFLLPLEDGFSSGRSWCAAGWVRGMRGKSLHFPGTDLQQHLLPLCPWVFGKDFWRTVRDWLNPGWFYPMWRQIIPESPLAQRNHRREDSLASLEVHFLDSGKWTSKVFSDNLLSWWYLNLTVMADGAGIYKMRTYQRNIHLPQQGGRFYITVGKNGVFPTRLGISSPSTQASQVALVVKNLPSNAGDMRHGVRSMAQEDPLKEGMATHSRILAWRIPWTKEPAGL